MLKGALGVITNEKFVVSERMMLFTFSEVPPLFEKTKSFDEVEFTLVFAKFHVGSGDEKPGRAHSGADPQGAVIVDAGMMGAVPKQAVQPQGALDPDKMRQVRFMRAMERGMSSVAFESDAWMAQFDQSREGKSRGGGATRLLLAAAPQSLPDQNGDSMAQIRALVLDAAYQVK